MAQLVYINNGTRKEEDFSSVPDALKKVDYYYTDVEGMESGCYPLWIEENGDHVWEATSLNFFLNLISK